MTWLQDRVSEVLQIAVSCRLEMMARHIKHISYNIVMNLCLWVLCFQGDLKQYLKLAKAKEEKPKSHHLSTKQKVSIYT